MRVSLIVLFSALVVGALIDLYIWRRLKRSRHRGWARLQAVTACLCAALLCTAILTPYRSGDLHWLLAKMWMLLTYYSVYLGKFTACVFDWLAALPRLWRRHRLTSLTWAGIVFGALVFGALWWGALVNRFRIDVRQVTVEDSRLPEAFDGYRIAQLSDLHVGTFGTDTAFVSRLVDSVNALRPDLVVFTGDMVNRQSSEARPFERVLARLKAPDGVAAVQGNHDYGDYRFWANPADKRADVDSLVASLRRMNMRVLRNQTAWLRRGTDSVALVGVENIGDPPFFTYGSLPKAYPGTRDSIFKILLSHNPAHWLDSISPYPEMNIPLTLTGHTHAMQVEVMGLSPAALRYPAWGGMYDDRRGHRMYVNRGAGTVGLPFRVGATPEITLLTLKKHP